MQSLLYLLHLKAYIKLGGYTCILWLCIPSYHFHHPRHPAGCWWTEWGQRRWDPESSTGSSGNHLSSTCHILKNKERDRETGLKLICFGGLWWELSDPAERCNFHIMKATFYFAVFKYTQYKALLHSFPWIYYQIIQTDAIKYSNFHPITQR